MNNTYWLIDSEKLNNVELLLCGYMVDNDGNFITDSIPETFCDSGCFTLIKKTDDTINIYQDFLGSQGIYVYTKKKRFIISNGFVTLINYLNSLQIKLDVNRKYELNYIFLRDLPFALNDTIINGIQRASRNVYITIDIKKKSIKYNKFNYSESTLNIDSKEGIETLDKWFYKWTKVFRNLVKQNGYLNFDLSGGFDSRVIFGMVMSSNIDKKYLSIHRNDPAKSLFLKSSDDAVISNEIVNYFGVQDCLNNFPQEEQTDDYKEFLDKLLNTKLANNHYCSAINNEYYTEPYYHICGCGGECIHGYLLKNKNKHLETRFTFNFKPKWNESNIDLKKNTIFNEYIYYKNGLKYLHDIEALYDNKLEDNVYGHNLFAREYFTARFNGSKLAFNMFCNKIYITPYTDSLIHKLKINNDEIDSPLLLESVLQSRYVKELATFPVLKNRTITNELSLIANRINAKYPLVPETFDKIDDIEVRDVTNIKSYMCYNAIEKHIISFLLNNKEKLIPYFGKNLYKYIYLDLLKPKNLLKHLYTMGVYYILAIRCIIKNSKDLTDNKFIKLKLRYKKFKYQKKLKLIL